MFTLNYESDSDASSVKSMLQGRDLPSHFDKENNYYMLYWKTYLENEQVLNDIQETANENVSTMRRIYNIEDYYDNNLLPKMLSFPKQYINRITGISQQKRINETKQMENIRLYE
jgi:hypothetical protein